MQTREEWLKGRKEYVGGSEIAAIAGLSPYKTALEVYMDKISDEVTELKSEAAEWGIALEPLVANKYAAMTSYVVSEESNVIRHPEHPFLAANIDRWVNDKEFVLECKTASFRQKDYWGRAEGTDAIPDQYLCQVAFYAAICDVPKVDVAVFFDIQDFRIYTYDRNKDFENKLIKIGINFWNNNVLARVPPEPRTVNDCALLYPRSIGDSITANDEIELEIKKMRDLKVQEKLLTSELNESQIKIKSFMQANQALADSSGLIVATWRNTERGNRMFLIK